MKTWTTACTLELIQSYEMDGWSVRQLVPINTAEGIGFVAVFERPAGWSKADRYIERHADSIILKGSAE